MPKQEFGLGYSLKLINGAHAKAPSDGNMEGGYWLRSFKSSTLMCFDPVLTLCDILGFLSDTPRHELHDQ
jgi:hypothetical protein